MVAKERARLAVELAYYAQHKSEWVKQQSGNYVVVRDKQVLGFFPSFEAAYRLGATTYGIGTDFLVKQILEHEPVFFVY
jgi:hypothetical protein